MHKKQQRENKHSFDFTENISRHLRVNKSLINVRELLQADAEVSFVGKEANSMKFYDLDYRFKHNKSQSTLPNHNYFNSVHRLPEGREKRRLMNMFSTPDRSETETKFLSKLQQDHGRLLSEM